MNTQVPGMPGIILKSDNAGKQYSFSSSEYFLYPTHKSQTIAQEAIVGLHMKSLYTNDEPIVQLGMLFVQKYGLRIEYTPMGDENIYVAYIYSKSDHIVQEMGWPRLVFWFLSFTLLSIILY